MTTLLAAPMLRAIAGPSSGKTFTVDAAVRIGRHPYNEVSLEDKSSSRYHCWITPSDTGCFIEDLASTNGTYVNGVRLKGRRKLESGDTVRVGLTRFVFAEE